MANSFIGKVLGRKKRRRLAVKISCAAAAIALFLTLCLHIANVFILNAIFEKTVEKFKDNPNHSILYTTKYDFLRSRLHIKDARIMVNNGDINIGNVYISKKRGFVLPSIVSNELKDIEVLTLNGKKFNVVSNKNIKFDTFFNKHLFKKPDFGGVAIEEPLQANLVDENSIETGSVKVDDLNVRFDDVEKKQFFRSSGILIFNDGDASPMVLMANRPFKWDIDVREVFEDKKWGIKKENTETIYTTKIEKFVIDYTFAKTSMQGIMVRGAQLKQSDLLVEIENYNALLENMFNMSAKDEQSNTDLLKKMYRIVKNDVVPMLKKKQSNPAKNVLSMKVKKEEFDEEASVNGVPMSTIFKKLTSVK